MAPLLVARMPEDVLPPLPREPWRVFDWTGVELPNVKIGVESF